MTKFIVTGAPSVSVGYRWRMIDSLDGVKYDTFGAALQQCKILNGCGVEELWEESDDKETGNDSED